MDLSSVPLSAPRPERKLSGTFETNLNLLDFFESNSSQLSLAQRRPSMEGGMYDSEAANEYFKMLQHQPAPIAEEDEESGNNSSNNMNININDNINNIENNNSKFANMMSSASFNIPRLKIDVQTEDESDFEPSSSRTPAADLFTPFTPTFRTNAFDPLLGPIANVMGDLQLQHTAAAANSAPLTDGLASPLPPISTRPRGSSVFKRPRESDTEDSSNADGEDSEGSVVHKKIRSDGEEESEMDGTPRSATPASSVFSQIVASSNPLLNGLPFAKLNIPSSPAADSEGGLSDNTPSSAMDSPFSPSAQLLMKNGFRLPTAGQNPFHTILQQQSNRFDPHLLTRSSSTPPVFHHQSSTASPANLMLSHPGNQDQQQPQTITPDMIAGSNQALQNLMMLQNLNRMCMTPPPSLQTNMNGPGSPFMTSPFQRPMSVPPPSLQTPTSPLTPTSGSFMFDPLMLPMNLAALECDPNDDSIDRKYSCPKPHCSKVYKNSNGLKYHMRHGQCEMDGFITEDGDITAEEAIMQRPYWCKMPGCGKKYKNLNGLKYHAKVAHPHLDYRVICKNSRVATLGN